MVWLGLDLLRSTGDEDYMNAVFSVHYSQSIGSSHVDHHFNYLNHWTLVYTTESCWYLLLRFHRTVIILLTFFFYELRSRTLCAQWTYHVTLARLLVHFPLCHVFLARVLVCPRSRFTCLSYFTVLDCQLVYAYHFTLCLPLLSRRLVCRVVIPGL